MRDAQFCYIVLDHAKEGLSRAKNNIFEGLINRPVDMEESEFNDLIIRLADVQKRLHSLQKKVGEHWPKPKT